MSRRVIHIWLLQYALSQTSRNIVTYCKTSIIRFSKRGYRLDLSFVKLSLVLVPERSENALYDTPRGSFRDDNALFKVAIDFHPPKY